MMKGAHHVVCCGLVARFSLPDPIAADACTRLGAPLVQCRLDAEQPMQAADFAFESTRSPEALVPGRQIHYVELSAPLLQYRQPSLARASDRLRSRPPLQPRYIASGQILRPLGYSSCHSIGNAHVLNKPLQEHHDIARLLVIRRYGFYVNGPSTPSSSLIFLAEQLWRHAMLMAIRRASSFVSTFACRTSASLSRE